MNNLNQNHPTYSILLVTPKNLSEGGRVVSFQQEILSFDDLAEARQSIKNLDGKTIRNTNTNTSVPLLYVTAHPLNFKLNEDE